MTNVKKHGAKPELPVLGFANPGGERYMAIIVGARSAQFVKLSVGILDASVFKQEFFRVRMFYH